MALLDAAAAGRARLTAPEFGALEFANVLWKSERRGYLRARRVEAVLRDLPLWGVRWAPALPLLERSLWFARATGEGIYDGAFLALSESLRASFVTADRRLLGACAGRFDFVVPLARVSELLGA